MNRFGLGVWTHSITGFRSRDEVEAQADLWAKAGYDIVIPCVKNPHGAADFLTDAADVNPDYPEWDPLKLMVEACKARGIKVHVWFCVFPEGDRSRLLREHPQFQAKFEAKHRWACACRPEVQDYLFELYKSVALRYRPAGLHLDYIRTGGICTCEFCKAEMHRRGVEIADVELRNPAYEQWVEWRVSRITDFVSRLREFTRSENLELSAAVFAGYPDSRRTQGQDWIEWAEKGLVDYLLPMNYTNSTRWAAARTISHAALIGGKAPLWEGLGKSSSASQLTTEVLTEQVKAVLAAGAQGIVLFSDPAVTEADIQAVQQLRSA